MRIFFGEKYGWVKRVIQHSHEKTNYLSTISSSFSCDENLPNTTTDFDDDLIIDPPSSSLYACFAKNKFDIGNITKYEAQIKLAENCYVAKKLYCCSFDDQKEIESQITELLKHGMIEQSMSPFASPVTLAYKKEGDVKVKNRMCVDFRELNRLVVSENFPFPLIEDLIIETNGCEWFSSLDINSAFWTIPIHLFVKKIATRQVL